MNASDGEIKACCANFYQSDIVRMLLGDSLHPGGPELTHHLGEVLKLGQGDRVLDVACGAAVRQCTWQSTLAATSPGLTTPRRTSPRPMRTPLRRVSHI